MQHRDGHPLAVLDFGTLRHDRDDPRLAPSRSARDAANAIGRRGPGFVWMLVEDGMDAARTDSAGPFGDTPRTASTLSVRQDAPRLMAFGHQTRHARFRARQAEGFDPADHGPVVMGFGPVDTRPTLAQVFSPVPLGLPSG